MSKHTATHMTKIIEACEKAKEQLRATNSVDGIQNALVDMSVAFIDGLARVVDAEGGDNDYIQPNEIIRDEIKAAMLVVFERPYDPKRDGNAQHSTMNFAQTGVAGGYGR
jgi:hypothetical protein